MKNINLISVCIFFVFIFVTLYLSLDNRKIYNTEDIIGQKLEQVELNIFKNNKTFNTKEISNYKFTLINFWASWCGPCRKEHKNLIKLSKNKNLKLIGVNFKDNKNEAKKFLEEMGDPFFILAMDPQGKKSVNFGVYGIPETILVNQDLEILKKYIGPLDFNDVNEIEKIVKQ
tara:strand:- start:2378 stop:2896 length:519 start_codon:yes stop_codon:yes gene_type:complete